jgi:uncharacterized protein (DUF2062 family)
MAERWAQEVTGSVDVLVVQVWRVRVPVAHGQVLVRVAVRTLGHQRVVVVVVPVVVAACVWTCPWFSATCTSTPATISAPPCLSMLADRSPSANAASAPMKAAKVTRLCEVDSSQAVLAALRYAIWLVTIMRIGRLPSTTDCCMAEFKNRLRRWFPTAQTLQNTKGFSWLSHYLHRHPMLWVLHRRGVAMGVALGIAIGVFPVPLQMPVAMLAAVALRGNVAAAAAATWLTNPFTMAPIWALAAYLGSFVLPQHTPVKPSAALANWHWASPTTWPSALWEQIVSWGPTMLVGFPLAGLLLGCTAYAVVYWGWAVLIRRERLRRRTKAERP